MYRWRQRHWGALVKVIDHAICSPSLSISLFIFFPYSLSFVTTVVTDGLGGLGIDRRGILSLFPDIFPIATLADSGYLLSTRREKRGWSREEGGMRYASVKPLKKLNASGHLPLHRFLLNNTTEHPERLMRRRGPSVNKTPRNVLLPFLLVSPLTVWIKSEKEALKLYVCVCVCVWDSLVLSNSSSLH